MEKRKSPSKRQSRSHSPKREKALNRVIIHVSGPSGSGKTTLGNKLKEIFENKIEVKDLDELLDDHLKDYFGEQSFTYNDINEDAYQEYIDNWIDKHKKPIVFVGLNDNFVDFYPTRKNIYYNVHPQYKYYIDIDDSIIVKQKCMRFFDNLKQDMNLMNDLVSNNQNFIKQISKAIHTECNSKFILKWVNKWRKDYQKQGYTFLDRDEILKEVTEVLNL